MVESNFLHKIIEFANFSFDNWISLLITEFVHFFAYKHKVTEGRLNLVRKKKITYKNWTFFIKILKFPCKNENFHAKMSMKRVEVWNIHVLDTFILIHVCAAEILLSMEWKIDFFYEAWSFIRIEIEKKK